jgi:isochorismate synthase
LTGRFDASSAPDVTVLENALRGGRAAFYWESPEGESVLGVGSVARFEASGAGRFEAARGWMEALGASASAEPGAAGMPRVLAVGGFAFSPGSVGAAAGLGDAVFTVPEEVWHRAKDGATIHTTWRRRGASGARPTGAHELSRASIPSWSEEEWSCAVRAALERIEAGEIEKVVLSRAVEIVSSDAAETSRSALAGGVIDPVRVLTRLGDLSPRAYRYLVAPHGRSAFVGASPERLLALRGGRVTADAVAGTAVADSGAEGSMAAVSLLASGKDRREHDVVVRHIVEALGPCCEDLAAEPGPEIQRIGRLAHLRTRVAGRARAGAHVLDLVARLHPTPAVAGTPRDAALAFLRQWEPSHRGWYAGPVGWMDASGEGDFAVGIRSALITGGRALLFAGAGIVAGSDPRAEWAETDDKLAVMREAIADAGR